MNRILRKTVPVVLALAIVFSSFGGTLIFTASAAADETVYLSSTQGKALENGISVGWGSLTYDQNINKNGKITINKPDGSGGYTATEFDKGIVAHAEATLNYNIENQGFTKFRAYLGVDVVTAGASNSPDIIYYIYLDGSLVYTSSDITKTTAAAYVDLDIAGAKTMKIYIKAVSKNGAHSSLGDAQFVKEGTDGKSSITSVDDAAPLNLAFAESFKNHTLPTSVAAHLSDGSTANLGVTWLTDAFSSKVSGSTTIYGIIKESSSSVNVNGLLAKFTMNVAAQDENTVYLSDLTPTASRFDWAGTWLDAAVEYKQWTLMIDGVQTYMGKGVSANSNAEVTYSVPDGAESFEAYVGVTGVVTGHCSFAVYLDGVNATPAEIAGVIYDKTTNAGKISIDVTGKSTIQIRFITPSGYSNNAANGTFADAKFLVADEPRADYTNVNTAIAVANALNASDYTLDSYRAVVDAVAAVVTGKYATEQAEVDTMADAINTAITNLQQRKPFALTDDWSFLNEDAARYELQSADQVAVMVGKGELWDSTRSYTNILLTDAGSDNFTATVKLQFSPSENYQSAGLIVYAGDTAFFSVQRRYHSSYNGNCIGYINVVSGSPSEAAVADTAVGSDVYLKIVKNGSSFEGFYSTDNQNWTSTGTISNAGLSDQVKVGLYTGKGSYDSSVQDISAVFSDFTLNNSSVDFAACTDAEVNAVTAAIEAIGTVTASSGDAITAAEADYAALSSDQKALVANYQTLLDARTAYDQLTTVADYSAVTTAIAAIPADLSVYTDATAAAVNAAKNAVVYDLTADNQTTVDAYAAAINQAVAQLVLKTMELNINISEGMVTQSTTDLSKYNITWNATITTGADSTIAGINASDITFKEYGVYYATSDDVLADYTNASAADIRQKIFGSSADITDGSELNVYTMFGFRLKNVPADATRAAMFYVEYEYNGHTYIVLSTIDETIATIAVD